MYHSQNSLFCTRNPRLCVLTRAAAGFTTWYISIENPLFSASATCLLSNMLVHFNTPAQRLTSRTSNAVPALLRRFQQRTKNVVAVQKMGECFSPELLVASGADPKTGISGRGRIDRDISFFVESGAGKMPQCARCAVRRAARAAASASRPSEHEHTCAAAAAMRARIPAPHA